MVWRRFKAENFSSPYLNSNPFCEIDFWEHVFSEFSHPAGRLRQSEIKLPEIAEFNILIAEDGNAQ